MRQQEDGLRSAPGQDHLIGLDIQPPVLIEQWRINFPQPAVAEGGNLLQQPPQPRALQNGSILPGVLLQWGQPGIR